MIIHINICQYEMKMTTKYLQDDEIGLIANRIIIKKTLLSDITNTPRKFVPFQ